MVEAMAPCHDFRGEAPRLMRCPAFDANNLNRSKACPCYCRSIEEEHFRVGRLRSEGNNCQSIPGGLKISW
jgi:hypothetical protein